MPLKRGKKKKDSTISVYRGKIGEVSVTSNNLEDDVEWRIGDFLNVNTFLGEYYFSPGFSASVSGVRCCLGIYPNGRTQDSYGHVDLWLVKYSYNPSVTVEVCVSMGKGTNARSTKIYVDKFNYYHHYSYRVVSNLELHRWFELYPNGILTVECSIKRTTPTRIESSFYSEGTSSHDIGSVTGSIPRDKYLQRNSENYRAPSLGYRATRNYQDCLFRAPTTLAASFSNLNIDQCPASFIPFPGAASLDSCASASNVEETWKCRRCTLLNPSHVTNCEACLSSKFADDKSLEDNKKVVSAVEDSDKSLCIICLSKERDIAFQPCWHVATCSDCADRLTSCPVCRKIIAQKQKIFHS